jgi:phenylacetate-CoA ligase
MPSLKVITTGSETLLQRQRAAITQAFCVPIHEFYGQTECTAFISSHTDELLRVEEDFSHVEFVPEAGTPHICRIIGTNWTNPGFPLFRYDVGDVAVLACDGDFRGWPGRAVRSIDGRQEDYVLLPDGVKVGRLDHIFKGLVHVHEAQIHQHTRDSITVRVVKGPGYDAARQEKQLLMEARRRLGDEMSIEVEYVERIPRTARGKLRFVTSELREGHNV